MIFRVCEHYDDQNIYEEYYNKNYYNKECFICFEFKSSDGLNTINLMEQTIYLNNCMCNGSIHEECLKIWFDKNSSCPICREKMIERNNTTIIMFNYIPYGISFYFFIKKITLRILHIILVFMFFQKLIEFYVIVILNRYTNLPILDDENYI